MDRIPDAKAVWQKIKDTRKALEKTHDHHEYHLLRLTLEVLESELENAFHYMGLLQQPDIQELESRRRIMQEISDLLYKAQGDPGTRVFNQTALVDDVKCLIAERDALSNRISQAIDDGQMDSPVDSYLRGED